MTLRGQFENPSVLFQPLSAAEDLTSQLRERGKGGGRGANKEKMRLMGGKLQIIAHVGWLAHVIWVCKGRGGRKVENNLLTSHILSELAGFN